MGWEERVKPHWQHKWANMLKNPKHSRKSSLVLSDPPNIKKIQGDIARQLGLPLEEKREAEHSKLLWSRIAKNEGKLLIILDDVWGELNLKDIGIPSGHNHNHKNCYVLVTTRHSNVCGLMRCQRTIHLQILNYDDSLNLFLMHAKSNEDSSSSDLEGVGRDIVKECGGLPVAIVALASTLKNWPVGEWKVALTTLQNSRPLRDVDEDLTEVYKCLQLSYEKIGNPKAQKLFLLCSLFPEDYEIPISLFIRLGIGAGIFGEADKYFVARGHAVAVKNKLTASSLLLKAEKECVKLHDLVREVALWIAEEDVQVITDSTTILEANKRFLFWNIDDFPDWIDGTRLEILFLWVNGPVLVKKPDALFERMTMLKVLFLLSKHKGQCLPPSLSQSLLSLGNIRTIILNGWKLVNFSCLKYLQSLETLELENCSMTELPKEIRELKKLRLLGLRECKIERNNPFEVIGRCSQLEELYFVENENVEDWKLENDRENIHEVAHDISPIALQMYSIAWSGYEYFEDDDNGLLKCFNSKHAKNLISEAMFKYLAGRAEVLELGEIGETRRKSLVPGIIIPTEDGGMNDLIRLCLYESADIEFLIDTSQLRNFDVSVFSKLIELHLDRVEVKQLYWGRMPFGFLTQLQILKLRNCKQLHNIFFYGNLRLPHLKVLELEDCPIFQPSIFELAIARSLEQLEKLIIIGCKELKSLITDERPGEEIEDVDNQKGHGLLFPKLKSLQITECGKLELVSPLLLAGDFPLLKELYIIDCRELKYIFSEYRDEGQVSHQEIMLPSLTEMILDLVPSFVNIFKECKKCMQRSSPILKDDSKEKNATSRTRAFSWAHGCCFLPTATDTDIVVSDATWQDHTISQALTASMKWVQTSHTMECLLRQPLNLKNIRQMRLSNCSKVKSLFSVSIATTIMLEVLYIEDCEELKHIITNEGEDHHHINCTSIFPKLQQLEIWGCNHLGFIFPSTFSGGLQKLKSIQVDRADELKYVFGRYHDEEYLSNENQNNEHHIHLPALEEISLTNVRNMISICIDKYHLEMECPSLQNLEAAKVVDMHVQNVTSDVAEESEIEEITNVERPTTSTVGIECVLNFHNLREIEIDGCKKLKTMFSTSTWRSLPQLSELYIYDCEELVKVVEEDSKDHHHINYTSISPKLERLEIQTCNKLEFIFPHSLSGVRKLKSLSIQKVAELKYVFGKYHHGDDLLNQNESDDLHIDLPALETLSLREAPKMINICAKKCHLMRLPSLQEFALDNCQELDLSSFPTLTIHWKLAEDLTKIIVHMQNLRTLELMNSRMEEVFNMEGGEIEGPVILNLESMVLKNLSELRHICKGPKHILSLQNLRKLQIRACKKLRAIFSASMLKSFPQLSFLTIGDSEELVHIIEEDYEKISTVDHLHQRCFPKLMEIHIKCCNRLKCLFSISSTSMFPNLERLNIEKASELEQVFTCKQDETENMVMKDVFPNLFSLSLTKLPVLVSVCGGIDFQTVRNLEVVDCPKYQAIASKLQERAENLDSENQAPTKELQPANSNNDEAMPHEEASGSPNLSKNSAETMKKIIEEVPTSELSPMEPYPLTESQLRKPSLHELEDEQYTIEATLSQEDLGETKIFIEVPHKTNIPLDNDSVGSIQEEATNMKAKIFTSSIDSDAKGSQSSLSAMGTKEEGKEIAENVLAAETSLVATSFESEFNRGRHTIKETRDANIQEGPKSEKAKMENLSAHSCDFKPDPMEDNTILSDVIPSLHCQSHIGAAGPSSPILEIAEIFQLVELKDGEAALLAKALELYPQLRLPREHRTNPIIAFCYRVLVDILVMLVTKTPYAISASDKTTLENNLGAATFFGFDKDWIELVRAKVFGVDKSDVLVAEEKVSVMEADLETCDIKLEHIQKKRTEAKERLAIVQNEFEAVDSQLFDLWEYRRKLVIKMVEFRKIISAKDRPFGI